MGGEDKRHEQRSDPLGRDPLAKPDLEQVPFRTLLSTPLSALPLSYRKNMYVFFRNLELRFKLIKSNRSEIQQFSSAQLFVTTMFEKKNSINCWWMVYLRSYLLAYINNVFLFIFWLNFTSYPPPKKKKNFFLCTSNEFRFFRFYSDTEMFSRRSARTGLTLKMSNTVFYRLFNIDIYAWLKSYFWFLL